MSQSSLKIVLELQAHRGSDRSSNANAIRPERCRKMSDLCLVLFISVFSRAMKVISGQKEKAAAFQESHIFRGVETCFFALLQPTKASRLAVVLPYVRHGRGQHSKAHFCDPLLTRTTRRRLGDAGALAACNRDTRGHAR